jgi:hypothetical protein
VVNLVWPHVLKYIGVVNLVVWSHVLKYIDVVNLVVWPHVLKYIGVVNLVVWSHILKYTGVVNLVVWPRVLKNSDNIKENFKIALLYIEMSEFCVLLFMRYTFYFCWSSVLQNKLLNI